MLVVKRMVLKGKILELLKLVIFSNAINQFFSHRLVNMVNQGTMTV